MWTLFFSLTTVLAFNFQSSMLCLVDILSVHTNNTTTTVCHTLRNDWSCPWPHAKPITLVALDTVKGRQWRTWRPPLAPPISFPTTQITSHRQLEMSVHLSKPASRASRVAHAAVICAVGRQCHYASRPTEAWPPGHLRYDTIVCV